jgi:hypothetical protein
MKRFLIFFIFLLPLAYAESSLTQSSTYYTMGSNNPNSNAFGYQYTQPAPNFNSYYSSDQIATYWPILQDMQKGNCEAASDFMVMIPPGGCSPMVVRSDLLEEQNVPVFCQLSAIRINPLIKVSSIKSISFKGKYPDGVADISFHPAQAAIRSYNTLLGSPIMNNIGYAVIVLKKNPVEKTMPKWIAGNLTATIFYDADNAFGTGNAEFYLPVLSDDEWNARYQEFGFWNGKGFLRLMELDNGTAKLAFYSDKDNIVKQVSIKEGQTGNDFYMPGFYCRAGLSATVNSVVGPEDQAQLNVDGNVVWVRKGSKFLNDKCSVRDLGVISPGVGSVIVSCGGQTFTLVVDKKGALISIGGNDAQEFKAGQFVYEGNLNIGDKSTGVKKWYLAHIGKAPNEVRSAGGKDFIILVDSDKDLTNDQIAAFSNRMAEYRLANNPTQDDFEKFFSSVSKPAGSTQLIFIYRDGSNEALKFIGVPADSGEKIYNPTLTDTNYNSNFKGALLEEYFQKADDTVKYVIDTHPTDRVDDVGINGPWAEEALWEEIVLSENLQKYDTEQKLLQEYVKLYPDSKNIYNARSKISKSGYDIRRSSVSVDVANNQHYIGVFDFKKVDPQSKEARITFTGLSYMTVHEGDIKYLEAGKPDTSPYLEIVKINPGSVEAIFHNRVSSNGNVQDNAERAVVNIDNSYTFKGPAKSMGVSYIKVDQQAYVSLNPKVDNTKTDANFTFRIGIEKRDIKLSPQKTEEMIKNLNATIEKWDSANQKLAQLIKGWKGACFATSALLMVKSWAAGMDGTSMARQEVMKTYREKCQTEADLKALSPTECYNKLAPQINADVEARTRIINNVNNKISALEKNSITSNGGLFEESVVNEQKVKSELKSQIKSDTGCPPKEVKVGESKGASGETIPQCIPIDKVNDYDSLRAILTTQDPEFSKLSEGVRNSFISQKESLLAPSYRQYQADNKLSADRVKFPEKLQNSVTSPIVPGQSAIPYSGNVMTKEELGGVTTGNAKNELLRIYQNDQQKLGVQIVPVDGQYYLTLLGSNGAGNVKQEGKFFRVSPGNSNKLIVENSVDALPATSQITFVTGSACSNVYKSPQIKYYETDPNKGMPAIVPFDIKNGWYAKVSQSIGGFLSSTQSGYKASGEVTTFYVCNVGSDGKENNGVYPDDLCQSFDINTYASVNSFLSCPSMSKAEVQSLAQRAQEAIRQAAQNYGKKGAVKILGQDVTIGAPAGTDNGVECQDFMSPEDCLMLFNVCDPVICPSSRCDLGGAYKVPDVVQSGIIGSILLCLPNFKERVMVPVCLTGINAGIDSLISILKSERECLQKSLETGEHVGICDEITSVYLCEFFWRQLAPVMNILIPKMIESSYNGGLQGARGGGEYMTVMNSWNTLQNNIDYFRNTYAQNSFKAFDIRNVEEAGGTFCRAFIGTSLPTSAKVLDNLLAPESPEQIYAWFSETAYSGATVPATSQYKVYYHIYAGKDQGMQYQVYLKNPPASSYYNQNQEIYVKSGYIAKGDSADETIDFTAPAGYKEMCVVVNAQEHCGFKQVTTDFALQYLSKKYVSEQANSSNIQTEKECLSGTPSLLAVTSSPNIQTGLERSAQPSIAMDGIVRVCATFNPSSGVEVSSAGENSVTSGLGADAKPQQVITRWEQVGYCGNPNIKCWLDTNSVKKAVSDVQKIEGSLDGTWNRGVGALNGKADFVYTDEQTNSVLDSVQKKIGDDKNSEIKNVIDVLVRGASDYASLKSSIDNAIGVNQVGGIVYELENLGGTREIAARGYSNKEIARALYLKARVYMIVTRALKNEIPSAYSAQVQTKSQIDNIINQRIKELGLTDNRDGTYSRKDYTGNYTFLSDGTLIYSGGNYKEDQQLPSQKLLPTALSGTLGNSWVAIQSSTSTSGSTSTVSELGKVWKTKEGESSKTMSSLIPLYLKFDSDVKIWKYTTNRNDIQKDVANSPWNALSSETFNSFGIYDGSIDDDLINNETKLIKFLKDNKLASPY